MKLVPPSAATNTSKSYYPAAITAYQGSIIHRFVWSGSAWQLRNTNDETMYTTSSIINWCYVPLWES